MATLLISLTGAGSITSRSKELTAAHLGKLQAAYTARLQSQGIVGPTPQDVFDEMLRDWLELTANVVRNYEREAAAGAVQSITFT